jgi:adenylyltransferase/sulfurtransferase
VLLVGAGALGTAAARVLASAPLAALTIIDPDRVERANLATQVLYDESLIGRHKADAAAARLSDAGCRITPIVGRLDAQNADELSGCHDFIIDACDHPPTKLLVNAAALRTGTRFCYGGVARTGGLVLPVDPRRSACLACVFPDTDDEAGRGCHETGILGPVAGVVGALQALEALGALGLGAAFHPGRLALYELRGRRWTFISFPRDERCGACASSALDVPERRIQPCHS